MTSSAEERQELRDALRRAINVGAADNPPVLDPDWRASWPVLAEMGLPAFCVPADLGGFGNDVSAALLASVELGAALHASPYPAVVAATFALSRWLDADQRGAVLEPILAGRHIPAIAVLDRTSVVRAGAAGLRIDGRARLVLGAADADGFLTLGPDPVDMAFVRGDACAVIDEYTFDVTRSCADVAFADASGYAMTPGAGGGRAVQQLFGLLLAGDALGGVERTHERTTSYAKQRVAFGTAIGGFQAVQHRLVDHAVSMRGMRLLAEAAAEAMTTGAPDTARRSLMTQARSGARSVPLLHDLLQLCGAVGFTWEYGLHLFERRAHLSARLGGNPHRARAALAQLEGWTSSGSAEADV